MVEVQQTRDTCIDHLTVTSGTELEIMSNLKSASQIDTLIEGHIGKFFGSAYAWDKCETLLRSSISMNARGRDDLSGIGRTPDNVQGFQTRPEL